MKTLLELRAEKNGLIEKMSILVALGKSEKRALTEDENKTWSDDNERIKAIDSEIIVLERQEELNKQLLGNKPPAQSPEKKLVKRFDFFKALMTRANNQPLTGAELEVSQEGEKEFKRSGVTAKPGAIVIPSCLIGKEAEERKLKKRAAAQIGTGDGSPPIPVLEVDFLSVVRTPILIDTLGMTVWEGLTGNLPLPRMGMLNAAFVAEKSQADTSGLALAKDTLAPRRVSSSDRLTKELLSQTHPSIQATMFREFIDAIWRTVQVDAFDAAAADGTIHTSYEITDTVAATNNACILALEAAIENNFEGMAYCMSHANKALLKALSLDSGSGVFAFQNNMVNGYPAYGTAALAATNGGSTNTAFDFIFGHWKNLVIGQWGGAVEFIVDPYAYADFGEIKVTGSGLFDTGVANALSFSVARNASA